MPGKTTPARHLGLLAILSLVTMMGTAQNPEYDFTTYATYEEERWVDSVYNALSREARIGQLFMIRAHSNLGRSHEREVERLIREYKVGGLCFFQGSPGKQVELINRYQQMSDMPMLVAMDAEWGLGMRMEESTISFPKQLTLGAIQNNRMIYEMGGEVARQLQRVGVHVNFAPVADVNNNPANPVINYRSFGEDRYNVAVKSYMYMKGMQDNGIIACAKHFPGHGDTDVDSHLDLPVIRHERRRLDSVELYPFRTLSDYSIGSMMIAHLQVPVLDGREYRPTTLSRNTVTNLLKRQMNFRGLIFTDALDMRGVTKHFPSGEVEAEALMAGNDVLVLPEDLSAARREIQRYLRTDRIGEGQLENSVKKILRAKFRMGLTRFIPISTDNVLETLNQARGEVLRRNLLRDALTLVRNDNDLVPLVALDTLDLAALSIGVSGKPAFQERLSDYTRIDTRQVGRVISGSREERLLDDLGRRDAVIVGLHGMNHSVEEDFGISDSALDLIYELQQRTEVILVVFGSPYALRYFDYLPQVLQAYEDNAATQDLAAQALFGAFGLRGRLPVTASIRSAYNSGVRTRGLGRLGYGLPEEEGMRSQELERIDELMERAVRLKATPGGVVLVAKNGKIVYHRGFGHHTYAKRRPVDRNEVYDLASLTKVAATTLSVMRLQDEGKLDVDDPLSRYLPELRGTNKEKLTIREIMSHHAGLIDWIPFYRETIAGNRRPSPEFYRHRPQGPYTVPVIDGLYMRQDYLDSIRQRIIESELRPRKTYKYSDLGFYLLADMVQRVSGMRLDEYAARQFYRPLGLQTVTFRPWEQLSMDDIAPTEEDRYFRGQRVQGYVHDMGAAMMGGVSGHAGLFANARDLAAIMQLFLQGGYYGGHQLVDSTTVKAFTRRFERSDRRGIGFDMKPLRSSRQSPHLSARASTQTFGHTGFTGTCAWVDPKEKLIFIFLSNRTYPSMRNYKLNKMEYRARVHTIAYESMRSWSDGRYFPEVVEGK